MKRLAVDPHSDNILFFGARSGHGLWKSTDFGTTWAKVSNLPSAGMHAFSGTIIARRAVDQWLFAGSYAPDPSDSSGINSDKTGVTWVTFDSTSGVRGQPTPRVFVAVADVGTDNIFVSEDAGSTCA